MSTQTQRQSSLVSAYVRLYAEVSTEKDAQELCDALVVRVESYGKIIRREVYHYWKIKEYYGVFVKLEPSQQDSSLGEDIIKALGNGWEFRKWKKSFSAIWNPSPNGELFSPLIRWGNVEFFDDRL